MITTLDELKGALQDIESDDITASTIRGYHVYKKHWTTTIGEVLQAKREEPGNAYNRYAIVLTEEYDGIVGHVPKNISKFCYSFLSRGGTIEVIITGPCQFAEDLPQGRLDVPCKYNVPFLRREVTYSESSKSTQNMNLNKTDKSPS